MTAPGEEDGILLAHLEASLLVVVGFGCRAFCMSLRPPGKICGELEGVKCFNCSLVVVSCVLRVCVCVCLCLCAKAYDLTVLLSIAC